MRERLHEAKVFFVEPRSLVGAMKRYEERHSRIAVDLLQGQARAVTTVRFGENAELIEYNIESNMKTWLGASGRELRWHQEEELPLDVR